MAIKQGESVPIAHPKEVYYAMAAQVIEHALLEPLELGETNGPAEFENAFGDELRRRVYDSYFGVSDENLVIMREAFRGYMGTNGNTLMDLYAGVGTAATLGTALPWTVRSRNADRPVKGSEFTQSFRVLRRLSTAHLTGLLGTSKLPAWTSPDGQAGKVLADDYTYDHRGLWLPKDFNEHPQEGFGPRIGCPMTLSQTATSAFMNFVKKETTNPARNILHISSQE